MLRQRVLHMVLTLLVSVSLVSLVPIDSASEGVPRSTLPQVVATVTSLAPRGIAMIRTVDGATYEVLKGSTWRVGDTVACEQRDASGVPTWQALDCRKM